MKLRRLAVFALSLSVLAPAVAQAALTVTPLTWNVIGLDSNSPGSGPRYFPVGARVCSSTGTSNVDVGLAWDSANSFVNLRAGSQGSVTIPAIAAGTCKDAYFEVEVAQVAAAFDTVRRYHITATDGADSASTPTPRELYVEHLISQNRNAVTGVKLDGVAIAPGGAMNLVVGNTYAIELDGGTATQGYNQFEAFINFPNTIFQILSVSTTYSANSSPYVSNPSDKLYADACLWQNDPASPNYRSCAGGDFKAGGSDVRTTYTVRIIGGGGTSQPLYALLYDFSGSSFHYNGDFAAAARIANIVDPTSLGFAKAFAPATTVPGGTSTLTFTISNTTGAAVSGASFSDTLPALSGSPMTVASPATYSTSGCGTPTFAPLAGATSISFANATIAANSSCVVSVQVSVPAAPTTGTYVNTSGNLFVGSVDTGKSASANLGVATTPGGTGACNLTLAQWSFAGYLANPPAPSTQAANVGTAGVTSGNGLTLVPDATASGGNPQPGMRMFGWPDNTAINTATSPYVQFAIDTSNYTQVTLRFDAQRKANGPGNDALYYSTDGVNWTQKATFASTTTWTTYGAPYDFTGQTSTTGVTYFRIYGNGAANPNSGADLSLDNVTFGGCSTAAMPGLTKSFAPNPVAVGGTATLTFTITNANTVALNGVTFTDALPPGLQVAGAPSASTTCAGAPTWSPAAGATTLTFGQPTGAIVPARAGAADGACTVRVDVTATTAGPHTNVSGFIASTESGTNAGPGGSAVATLTALSPPGIAKSFAPNVIPMGGTSVLTITIANPNTSETLSGVAFSDVYPAGLVNISPLIPAVTNTCGGTVTAAAGGGGIALSGGALAAGGSCTITVTVRAATAGSYANSTGPVAAGVAGTGNTAGATLVVSAPQPAISLLKNVGTSSNGPWFKFVTVAPGTNVYYQFIVENVGNVALSPFGVSDPTLAGTGADPATCAWSTTTLPVATATNDPTATCVVGPIVSLAGDHPNTATAHGTYGAITDNSTPSVADYIGATPGFSLLKQVGPSATGPWSSALVVASGGSVFYKFTIINTGAFALEAVSVTDPLVSTASCTFSSPLPVGGATTCVVGPVGATGAAGSTTPNTAIGHGVVGATSYDTPPSTASYTIAGATADLAIAKSNGTSGVTAGGSTTYTITVTNNGPAGVTGAVLADPAVAGLAKTAVACSATPGQCASPPSVAQLEGGAFALPALASGATYRITVTADVTATGGTVANTATIAAPAGTTDPDAANNTATDTDTVAPSANLAVVKTDTSATYTPGGTGTYVVTVTNTGISTASSVTVSDTLPAGVTLNGTVTCATTGTASCGSVTGIVGQASFGATGASIAAGAGNALTFTAPVAYASAMTADPLTNTATATDPASPQASGSDSSSRSPGVALAVVKTDGSATYTPGGTASYTVTVTNTGPSDAASVTVTDTLPAGLTLTANVGCTANGVASCGTVTGAAGQTAFGTTGATLGAGAGDSLVFTVPVSFAASMTTSPLVNTATATDIATGASASGSDSDALAVQVTLAVVKTDGSNTYTPGGTATYTVTVSNNGVSTAGNVTVTDALPAGVTLTASATCVASGASSCGTVTGTAGQASFGATGAVVVPGAANVLTFTMPVAFAAGLATDPLVNTASATDASSGASGSGSDSDARAAQVTLVVAKTDNASAYTPGGTGSYVITVTNTGTSDALNVTVNDPLPSGVTLTGTVTCAANGVATCGTVSGTSGQTAFGATGAGIGAGAGNALVFTAPVAYAANLTDNPLVNTATATDLASGATASGSDSDARAAQAGLAIAKSDNSATYTPGGTGTYVVTVTNAGPSAAVALVVADALPAGVTLTASVTCVPAGTATCGAVTGSAGQTSFGTTGAAIAAGPGHSLTFSAPVAFAAGMTANPLLNTASAAEGTQPPVTASDADSLSPAVSLMVTKSDGSATYTPGGTAVYTVNVYNTGISNAASVSVSDPLPAGVVLAAAATCAATGSAQCGVVTGTAGQTSFGTTGASIAAGPGNRLTFAVPVAFAPGLTANPLVNTVTVNDVPSGAHGSAADSDVLAAGVGPTLAKAIAPAAIVPGGTATLTLALGNPNASPQTLAAAFTDPMPAGVTTTSGNTGTCPGVTVTATTITMAAGSTIPPGGCTIVVTITSSTPGTVTNTTGPLQASGGTAPPASAPITVTTPGSPVANLSITKTNNATSVTPGNVVTYVIVVANGGPNAVTGATVADAVPAALTGVTWTCAASAGSGCPGSGSGSINTTVDLLPGGTATFIVTGTLASGASGTLTNTATVAPPTGTTDPNPANNTATDSDPIVAMPVDLAIAKQNTGPFAPGQVGARYAIVVSNVGTVPTSGPVTVTDVLPPGLTATAIGGTGWSCTQPAGPCTRSDPLAPGASYPVITLTVNIAVDAPSPVVNVVNVTGGGDGNGANNSAKNVVDFAPALPVEPIPVDSPAMLLLLAALLLLAGGWRMRGARIR